MDDLFSASTRERSFQNAPLAVRMRPNSLDEYVGQQKAVGKGSWLRAAIEHDVLSSVILYGPAGTGKTYLAVAMAISMLQQHQVKRIVLTRPAVEAGERLGFLPGDLQNKVDPYLRPLYDALFDMLGAETYQKYVERGNIEVAPLAYMRGRS